MVKCVICDVSLLMPNHGVGAKALDKIKEHYIQRHNIQEDISAFIDYLKELVTPGEIDMVVRFCYCTDQVFASTKQLALHQLINGCAIEVNQIGAALVSVSNEAPSLVKKTRVQVLNDIDVEEYYQFSVEEYSISSVSLFELKYERIIQTLDINDKVLPPLTFLYHAIKKVRNEMQYMEKNT